MARTTDVLSDARELVEKRLAELNEERERLERALAELGGRATRRSPGRSRSRPKSAASSSRKAGRNGRRGRGVRADQAVKLIEEKPGIGAQGIAKALKIKPNYLYRVLGSLEEEGRVQKDGRQLYPVRSAR